MRDASILKMHEANGRRSALLLEQFEFLQTRQEAFESVLKASSFGRRLKWLLWPDRLLRVVDAVQRVLLDQHRRAYAEAAEAAAKPKVVGVGAGVEPAR